MADFMSILSSNYSTVGSNVSTSKSKYVNVDPSSYEGSWTGKYGNNTSFTVSISNVSGFRARVKYQSGSTVQYQNVLIRDSSFRIGDSKFTLASKGVALLKTVVTDPVTGGTSVMSAYARQS